MTTIPLHPARIAVIIVNYNAASLVVDGIKSVLRRKHGGRQVEIHVVDNESPDGDAAILQAAIADHNWGSDVILYPEHENHGFGRGNNIALSALAQRDDPPEYVFLLNPDAQLENETLEILARFLDEHPKAAFAGAQARNPGAPDPVPAAFRYPSLGGTFESAMNFGPVARLFRHYKVALPANIETTKVDWVSGAGVMFRRSVIEQVGRFDPFYFLYFEEVDLMRACTRANHEGWYVAEARLIHIEGASTDVQSRAAHTRPRRPAYWYDSWQYYFVKNHGRVYALGTALAWMLAAALNHVLARLRGQPPYAPRKFFGDLYRYAIRPILGGRATRP